MDLFVYCCGQISVWNHWCRESELAERIKVSADFLHVADLLEAELLPNSAISFKDQGKASLTFTTFTDT